MPTARPETKLTIAPLSASLGLRARACEAIRAAITRMDIYGQAEEIRLDERQLCADLGVSRTRRSERRSRSWNRKASSVPFPAAALSSYARRNEKSSK